MAMTFDDERLTGRYRYRVQAITHKMVLQVEISFIHTGFIGDIACDGMKAWRDARLEDLENTR